MTNIAKCFMRPHGITSLVFIEDMGAVQAQLNRSNYARLNNVIEVWRSQITWMEPRKFPGGMEVHTFQQNLNKY